MNVLLTTLASVLVFGLVILIHESGHFIAAKCSGIRVNEFSLGMGPKLLQFGKGETKYSLRALPIGGYVSMEGEDEDSEDPRAFGRAPVLNRILVVAAGAFMNMLLGFLVLCGITCSEDAITSRTVSRFYDHASTQASGLQLGDTILSVNGRKCYVADDILYEFARIDSGTAEMVVLRDGKKVTLPAVTFETREEEDGTRQIVIDFAVLPIGKNVLTVAREAVNGTISYARLVFLSFVDLITGRAAINDLSGPVGIVSVIAQTVSYGLKPLFLLLTLITVNLGVFNLLPLPALDGGRLFLLLFEAAFRRRIPEKYEAAINMAGFVLLLLLMVFVTYNDISRLIVG